MNIPITTISSIIVCVIVGELLHLMNKGRDEEMIKKADEQIKYKTRNKDKQETMVTIKNGGWTCPACKETNNENNDICIECEQPVVKEKP